VQSPEAERMFAAAGCRCQFLANGVDCQKYVPVSDETKQELRKKHHLETRAPVVLHVGPLRKWRNSAVLAELSQRGGCQVVAIVPTSNPSDKELVRKLKEAGCIVRQSYYENIEEIYALSDYYLFPATHKLGSIEAPLSVLEAMACNLRVITTRYGALPFLFHKGDGLYFADNGDILSVFDGIKAGNGQVHTRDKVLPHSWKSIAGKLEQIYEEAISR